MCCCDCLLVAALQDATKAPVNRHQGRSEPRWWGARATTKVSTDRIPHRLCGWLALGLLDRRAHRTEIDRT